MAEPVPENLRRTYDIVAEMPGRAVDDALAALLTVPDHPVRRLAVEKLLQRSNLAGLTALVAGYKDYDAGLQESVRANIAALDQAARACISSEAVGPRLSTIELIRESGNCRLAYLLSEALTRRCPRTVTAAAFSLTALAHSVILRRKTHENGPERRALRIDAQHLAEALERGLDSWQVHHRTEVLEGAMLLVDLTEPVLFKKAEQPRSQLARAINTLLQADSTPAMASFALRALRCPKLSAVAADKIGTATAHEFIEHLIDDMWVNVGPENANGCTAIRKLAWLDDPASERLDLSGARASKAVRLVADSGLPHERKLGAYLKWTGHSCVALSRAALLQLIRTDTPKTTRVLKGLAASDDPQMSQIAVQELFRRNPTVCLPSESNGGRRDVDGDAEFDSYWQRFDGLDVFRRQKIGRRLLETDQALFRKRIAEALTASTSPDRERALRILGELHLGHEMPERIQALIADPDDRVRSLAVATLTDIEGAAAIRILRRALQDPDPRVQANAIEVISDQDIRRWKRDLKDHLCVKHNRVRANAIKALLRHRDRNAAITLLNMLADPSPAHRISALWVVEQLELVSLVSRLQQMAETDTDQRIRDRAERVLCTERFAAAGLANLSNPCETES